jgi:hypothetical protein
MKKERRKSEFESLPAFAAMRHALSHLLRLRVLPNVASGGSEEDFVLEGAPRQKIVDMEKQTRASRYRRLGGGESTGVQRLISAQM